MRYPVLIKPVDENSFELSVQDLPGCLIKAEKVDDGLIELKNVIDKHLEILSEYGESIPHARTIDYHMAKNENATWAIIDVDIIPYLGKSQKINVTLPELLIRKMDEWVSKTPEHKTRSGFIASVCLNELEKGKNKTK